MIMLMKCVDFITIDARPFAKKILKRTVFQNFDQCSFGYNTGRFAKNPINNSYHSYSIKLNLFPKLCKYELLEALNLLLNFYKFFSVGYDVL
jgi:hypothetical protein